MKISRHNKRVVFAFRMFLVVPILMAAACSGQQPEQVVKEFNGVLFAKSKLELVKFLSNSPGYVEERSFLEYKRIFPNAVKEETASEKKDGFSVAPTFDANRSGEDLVNYIVPAYFFEDGEWSGEVKDAKVFDDEAVVRAVYTRIDPQSKKKSSTNYDLLLIKQANEWKIFKMTSRFDGDDRYYTYGFYAEPR